MISKYFSDFEGKILKKTATSKKSVAKGASNKGSSKINVKSFSEKMSLIVPSKLAIEPVRVIDSNGFAPEGADLIVYHNYISDIKSIMGGYVPVELVYGAFHVYEKYEKSLLPEYLSKIANFKQLSNFSEESEENLMSIPSFMFLNDTDASLLDLKNDMINYYMAKSMDHNLEVDILVVLNKGLLVKDWRDKRSYIGLETLEDTMMWFFILVNEYLDIDRGLNIDFRKYLKKDVSYAQY